MLPAAPAKEVCATVRTGKTSNITRYTSRLKRLVQRSRTPCTSLLCMLLVVMAPITFTGCMNPPAGSPAGLFLSSEAAFPGAFIALFHEGFHQGAPARIRFQGPDDFDLTVAAEVIHDGVARVAVPPLFSIKDGEFRAADVTVTAEGIDGATNLFITNPPMLDGFKRGELFKDYLNLTIDQLESAIDNTNDLAADFSGVDVSAQITAMMDSMIETQDLLGEFDQFDSLLVSYQTEVSGGVTVDKLTLLKDVDIDVMERLLAGVMLGVVEEAASPAGSNKSIRQAQLLPVDNPNFQRLFPREVFDEFERTANTVKEAPLLLLGGLGVMAGGVALLAGAQLAAAATVAGVVFTVAGSAYALASGAILSQSSRALLGEDASGFDLAQASLNELGNIGVNTLGAIPGKIGTAITAATTAIGARDTYDRMVDVKCQNNSQKSHNYQSAIQFCSLLNQSGGPSGDPVGGPEPTDCNGNGAFRIVGFTNSDGSTEADGGVPEICLSGNDPQFPVISWDPDGPLGDATDVRVGMVEPDTQSWYAVSRIGTDTTPLVPPIQHGDLTIPNTAPESVFDTTPAIIHPLCGNNRVFKIEVEQPFIIAATIRFEVVGSNPCDSSIECYELVGEFDEECLVDGFFFRGDGVESTRCQKLREDFCPDGIRGCDIGSFIILEHKNQDDYTSICTDPLAPWVTVSGTRARMTIQVNQSAFSFVDEIAVNVYENGHFGDPPFGAYRGYFAVENRLGISVPDNLVYGDNPNDPSAEEEAYRVSGTAPSIQIGDVLVVKAFHFGNVAAETVLIAK